MKGPPCCQPGNLWQETGDTYELCQARLEYDMEWVRASGFTVSNVRNCSWRGPYDWHGSFNDSGN